jgi:hypothetical protein
MFGPDWVVQLAAPPVPPMVQEGVPVGATPLTPVTVPVKTRVDPGNPVPLPVKTTPPTGGALEILTLTADVTERVV